MRTSITKILAAVICTVAFSHSSNGANVKDNIPGVVEQPAAYFYTGKPYDSDLGAYVFRYRNYSAEACRWTSADPSGFPNGTNQNCYVNGRVTSSFDPNGLTGKSVTWLYGYAGLSNPNAPDDSTDSDLLYSEFQAFKQHLQEEDSANPSPSYLNDSDAYTFSIIGSLSEIPTATEDDLVYLCLHGAFSVQAGSQWALQGNIYTTDQVMNGHSGVVLSGCGWIVNDPSVPIVPGHPELGVDPAGMHWPDLFTRWEGETQTHLYE